MQYVLDKWTYGVSMQKFLVNYLFGFTEYRLSPFNPLKRMDSMAEKFT